MKKFICGVVVGSICALSVSSFASGVWDNISVLKNDINVIVNGEKVTTDNFLYNDTTYLPLRAVSEALNQPVAYDESTNTAYIGEIKENMNDVEIKSKYVPSGVVKNFSYLQDGIYYLSVGYFDVKIFRKYPNIDYRMDETILSWGDKSWVLTWIDGDPCIPYDTFVDEIEPLLK